MTVFQILMTYVGVWLFGYIIGKWGDLMEFSLKFKSLDEFMMWNFNYLITSHSHEELLARYDRSINILSKMYGAGIFDLPVGETAVRVMDDTFNLREEMFNDES